MAIKISQLPSGLALLVLQSDAGGTFSCDAESLQALLSELKSWRENHSASSGLILTSGGTKSFCHDPILDAEIHPEEDRARAQDLGFRLCRELENLHCPTAIILAGRCHGLSLELALACDIRFVSDDRRTKLGFPEIKLARLPQWGGLIRLKKTVGIETALDLVLSGRMLSPQAAKEIHLCRGLALPSQVMAATEASLLELAAARAHGHHGKPNYRETSVRDYFLDESKLRQADFLRRRRKQIMREQGFIAPVQELLFDAVKASTSKADALPIFEPQPNYTLQRFRAARHRREATPTRPRTDNSAALHIQASSQNKPQLIAWRDLKTASFALAFRLLSRGIHLRVCDSSHEHLARFEDYVWQKLEQAAADLDTIQQQMIRDRLTLVTNPRGFEQGDVHFVGPDFQGTDPSAAIVCRIQDIEAVRQEDKSTTSAQIQVFVSPLFAQLPCLEIALQTDKPLHLAWLAAAGVASIRRHDHGTSALQLGLHHYLDWGLQTFLAGASIEQCENAARKLGFKHGPFQLLEKLGVKRALTWYRAQESRERDHDNVCRFLEDLEKSVGMQPGRTLFFRDVGLKRAQIRRDLLAQSPHVYSRQSLGFAKLSALSETLEKALQELAHIMSVDLGLNAQDIDLVFVKGLGYGAFCAPILTPHESRGSQYGGSQS